ncbi:MAG: hypothetical protein ABI678_03145 [Kofleriaceae bacterium]
MTLVRLGFVLLLVGCVKPGAAPTARSSYDLYHLCGDAGADGVCTTSAERGQLVDTNLATPSRHSPLG